jgi:hypothetical protein
LIVRIALTEVSLALMKVRWETPLFIKRGTHVSIPTLLLCNASHRHPMAGVAQRKEIPVEPLKGML